MGVGEIAAILLIGVFSALIKAITGMGYPIILVPVAALFVPIADAIIFVSLSNFVLNAMLAWGARHARQAIPGLSYFLGFSILGGIIGSVMLPHLPELLIRLLLIAIVVGYLGNRLRSPHWQIPPRQQVVLSPIVGCLAGVFQGAGGVSGPIISPWYLSFKLSRSAYIFAITSVFAVSGLAQIVVLALQGSFTSDLTRVALLLVPGTLAAQPIGLRLREKLSAKVFDSSVVTILIASALSILVKILF